jgi:Icc-related predicted phosphoesterase
MKVVCISDTHGQNLATKWNWPKGDMLIHAGDMTATGRPENLKKVAREILSLGYRYNIVVAGNHDRGMWEDRWSEAPFGRYDSNGWKLMPGITVLQDETVEVMGLRIYGTSWIRFVEGKYPFEIQELEQKWDDIPDDTDILITHMPPLSGILDVNDKGDWMGSHTLLKTVQDRVKPRLHVFGHIHAGHGKIFDDHTVSVNACLTGKDRKPAYPPVVVEL